MSIQKVYDFLDSQKIKYKTINYSPNYTKEELEYYRSILGLNLIETALIYIGKDSIAAAVFPANLSINFASLWRVLGTNKVRLLEESEFNNLYPEYEFGAFPPFGKLYNIDVYLAKGLERCENIEFYVGSFGTLIQMRYEDFERLLNFQKDSFFMTKTRYRVSIESIVPDVTGQEIKRKEHCYLGISLENKRFTTSKLFPMADWISQNFRRCKVLIGDSLHRIPLQIDKGLDDKLALNHALLLGRQFVDKEAVVFDTYSDNCSFDFVFCSDIQKTEEYFRYLGWFQDLFRKNERFSQSIHSFAWNYILRQFPNRSEEYERYVEMSHTYLLEELAIFTCLAQQDLSIMIYPGSIAIFKEISEGQHPDVPECLRQIVHVSLHLKKRRFGKDSIPTI